MNDYERIARVIRYLDARHTEQPELAALAERAGLSASHFHRLFARWAAITPKDFLQCLTLAHAKQLLRNGRSVLDAALDSGLSGPGRLHDLCVNLEAASPGEWKAGGDGWTLVHGFAESPFGSCLIAEGPRGICHLSFVAGKEVDATRALGTLWPKARLHRDDTSATAMAARVFASPSGSHAASPLRAFVRGTPFQVRVWRALLAIAPGSAVSYGQLGAALGNPSAARAVGTAVGANSLGFLVPCHRVLRETGAVGGYRWDPVRKRAMLAWESAPRGQASEK